MIAEDNRIEIKGLEEILIYGDSSIANLYYYCSTRPRIARNKVGYQIMLLHYSNIGSNDSNVGMLSFVVDLDLDNDLLDKLKEKLPSAKLFPMPWLSGKVAAMLIGGEPLFFTPSLFGSNSAAISMNLNMDQYLMLKSAGDKKNLFPLSMVYSLTFETFRKAYGFKVTFDASKFREWIQKKIKIDLIFISFEKVETFEELRESGVIIIESENMTGEDPPEGFKKAFLASMKSVLNPLPHFSEPSDDGSSGWSIGFSSSEIKDIQNISRKLDLNMIVSEPMLRKVFFQGVPIGLDDALKDLKDIEIPVGENFKQKLTIRSMSSFNSQPLTAVNVRIFKSGNFVFNKVFNKDNPKQNIIDLTHDPRSHDNYQYKCELYFDSSLTNLEKFESEYFTIEKDIAFLDIQPEKFFSNRLLNVSTTNDFPWDLINSVEVKLNIDDSVSVLSPKSIRIGFEMQSGSINAFASGKQSFDDISYNAVFYRINDNSTFSLTAYPVGRIILLNQLRKRRITFMVSETNNWGNYETVQITIINDCDRIQVWKTDSNKLKLNKSSPTAYFDYWFAGNDRKINYKMRFISKQNGNSTPKTVETEQTKIQILMPSQIINI